MMIKTLKNEKGILTLDFLFASVLVFAFSAILGSFAITLSFVEVVQYVSFASARNYSLAHLNKNRQRERAIQKYEELTNQKAIAVMVQNQWFKIESPSVDKFNSEFNPDPSMDSEIFEGVRIPISAPILYKRIPLLGTTGTDSEGFRANVQSFLAREPTFQECQDFMNARAQQLSKLGYNFSVQDVALVMDNGC